MQAQGPEDEIRLRRGARQVLLPPALAILAVLVGIGAANLASSRSPVAGGLPAIDLRSPSPAGTVSPTTQPSDRTPTTTVVTPTPTPTATSTATSTANPTVTVPPTPTPKPVPTVPASLRQISVFVYNATGVKGAAARMQAQVRAAGWPSDYATNVNYRLASTTVFYDAGQEASANALVASIPAIKAAAPRPREFADTGTLIVVVESDFAG